MNKLIMASIWLFGVVVWFFTFVGVASVFQWWTTR